jgi:hypothetical protein
MYYQATHEPVIKLSDPVQIKTIGALTEAVGLPHERGQSVIKIPEKLKSYNKLILSKEYQERVAEAKAKSL